MVATITIDEAIMHAAEKRARETGSTPDAVMDQVLRQGLGVESPTLLFLGNGLPQIQFDPAFEPTADALLDLLDRIRQNGDFGPPLLIPVETGEWVDFTARAQNVEPGALIAGLVQESLMAQDKWPKRNGFVQLLRQSNDTTVVTPELIKQLQEELELEDVIG